MMLLFLLIHSRREFIAQEPRLVNIHLRGEGEREKGSLEKREELRARKKSTSNLIDVYGQRAVCRVNCLHKEPLL